MDELTIGEEFGPEAEFFRSCDIAVLKKMLADLNPDDRRIVVLRCEKKMTYKKIGQLLGISAEAAKKRGERTFARLKEKYLKELCHES